MKNKKGITLISLTISIVVLAIIASILVTNGLEIVEKTKLQDLRTDMLLIQAKAKEYVEEVNFQISNKTDQTEIEGIKTNILGEMGTPLNNATEDVKTKAEATGKIENNKIYYYLGQESLKKMGLKEHNPEDYGYFIVECNIEEILVDVINTSGYKGNFTLTELNQLTEE